MPVSVLASVSPVAALSESFPAKTGLGKIEISGVTVRFGRRGVSALDGVDLAIEPGEFVVLLGPSGCGKSTLLNVIAGFVPPSEGTLRIDGQVVTEPSPQRPVVFQQHSLFPWMTVLENVAFGPRMLKRNDPLEIARRQIELVGLADFAHHYPSQISGGMQQRVGLARALAVEPPVLLMDEPFGALDAQTRLLMQEQLLRLWEHWRHTVVFVTHDIDEAIFLADRIVVLGLRPNAVRGSIAVDLPRPRGPEIRRSGEYQYLHGNLFGLIRQESLKAFGMVDPRNTV